MEILSLGSSILSVITITILGWFAKSYFPNYLKEKAKNTATKEDLEEITEIVETIKKSHNIEIEKLKAELNNQDKMLEKRKNIYENIVDSLRIFISGHESDADIKKKFYKTYSSAWLWAPDHVLLSLNDFLDMQVKLVKFPDTVTQEDAKVLYENVVIEMRKDVGFQETEISNYRFFNFN
mgnify:FL=1